MPTSKSWLLRVFFRTTIVVCQLSADRSLVPVCHASLFAQLAVAAEAATVPPSVVPLHAEVKVGASVPGVQKTHTMQLLQGNSLNLATRSPKKGCHHICYEPNTKAM